MDQRLLELVRSYDATSVESVVRTVSTMKRLGMDPQVLTCPHPKLLPGVPVTDASGHQIDVELQSHSLDQVRYYSWNLHQGYTNYAWDLQELILRVARRAVLSAECNWNERRSWQLLVSRIAPTANEAWMLVPWIELSKLRSRVHVRELITSDPSFMMLQNSIKSVGLVMPIVIDQNLEIIDGRHRVEACRRIGLSEVITEIHVTTTTQRLRNSVMRNMLHGR